MKSSAPASSGGSLNELSPVAASDVEIEQHEVDRLLLEKLAGEVDCGGLEHPVVLELEVHAAKHA